jgi:hypothetical protein
MTPLNSDGGRLGSYYLGFQMTNNNPISPVTFTK